MVFKIDICFKILKRIAKDPDCEELVGRRRCNLGLLPKPPIETKVTLSPSKEQISPNR